MQQKILIFRHSPDCPAGTTTQFFSQTKIPYDIHYWHESDEVRDLHSYSGLVILGGPQNVDEEHRYPWLKTEKQLIKNFLELNRPVLGICLGAQLIAEILGADVRRHTHTEAGWKSIQLMPEASALIPTGIKELSVFQWHAYRFLTPAGTKKFATNEITADQGYVYRDNVVCVQFHPESDQQWIEECSQDPTYPQGPFVDDAATLVENNFKIAPMTKWYFQLLENLFQKERPGISKMKS